MNSIHWDSHRSAMVQADSEGMDVLLLKGEESNA